MAAAIHRPIEVYYPDLDVWVKGVATGVLAELGRICVEFPDGSKRLLSKEKHIYKFTDEPQEEEPHANDHGLDLVATHATGGTDVDVAALKKEQEEQEAWLRSFSVAEGTSMPAAAEVKTVQEMQSTATITSHSMSTLGGGSRPHVLSPVVPRLQIDGHNQSQMMASVTYDHDSPLGPYKSPRGFEEDGFIGTDEDAERIAGWVLRRAQLLADPASVDAGGDSMYGLLTCRVSRARNLSALFSDVQDHCVSVRTCVVQAPIHPANRTAYFGDGTYHLLSETLKVDARLNPYTCRRTAVHRSAAFSALEADRASDSYEIQDRPICCMLRDLHKSLVEASHADDVTAHLDWWYLSGHLLFQIMEGDADLPAASHKLVGHAAFRICDIFAGQYDTITVSNPSGFSTHGWQEARVSLWLPIRAVNNMSSVDMDRDSHLALPPAIRVVLSIQLPPGLSIPREVATPRRIDGESSSVSPFAGARQSAQQVNYLQRSTASAPRSRSLSRTRTHKFNSTNTSFKRSKPHPLLDNPRLTSKSAIGAFGTPNQAMGAKTLPASVPPTDIEALWLHISALQQSISGLEAQVLHEKVSLARARAEASKARRLVALLAASPSPVLNIAKAKVATLSLKGSTKKKSADFTSEDLKALKSKAITLQNAIRAEIPTLQYLAELSNSEKDSDSPADVEELKIAIARQKGRLIALKDRAARKAALGSPERR